MERLRGQEGFIYSIGTVDEREQEARRKDLRFISALLEFVEIADLSASLPYILHGRETNRDLSPQQTDRDKSNK